MNVEKKTVLITGSAGALGSIIAVEFHKRNYNLILHDISLDNFKDKFSDFNREDVLFVEADVTKYDDVKKIIDLSADRFKTIDVLVNNAGIAMQCALKFHILNDWEKIMNVNVQGVVNFCKATIPHMVKNNYGRIINVASLIAYSGSSRELAYATSKGAVNGFSKGLARELKKWDITVNTVCPGLIATGLTTVYGERFQDSLDFFNAVSSINRPVTQMDVANTIILLASNEASHISGSHVNVDGGVL